MSFPVTNLSELLSRWELVSLEAFLCLSFFLLKQIVLKLDLVLLDENTKAGHRLKVKQCRKV